VSRKRHLLTNWKCCVSGVHDEKFANDAPKQGKFQYKMWLMLTPGRICRLAVVISSIDGNRLDFA
jgi:hypothetical protein